MKFVDICSDINECERKKCNPVNSTCSNTVGSFECLCEPKQKLVTDQNTEYQFTCTSYSLFSKFSILSLEFKIFTEMELEDSLISNDWQSVFSVKAFAGIDLYSYFSTGDTSPAFPHSVVNETKIFRANNIQDLLTSAMFIRFSIYDVTGSHVAVQLVFEVESREDADSWFHWDRLVHRTSWDNLGKYESSLWVQSPYFNYEENRRAFEIVSYVAVNKRHCSNYEWFVAVTTDFDERQELCDWERFWNPSKYPDYEHLRVDSIDKQQFIKRQPPIFSYWYDERYTHALSLKVTIEVF